MSATVTLPVCLRVGDGEEIQVGWIEADSAEEMLAEMPAFLRALSDGFEQVKT